MALNGWQTLGAALGNNPQNSYNTGVTQGIQQGNLLEQARALRNKQLALSAMTPAVMQAAQAGDKAAQGIVAAAMVSSGSNYQEQASGASTEQGIGFKNAAMDAMNGPTPDQNKANNILAVLKGEPQKLSAVEGGIALNPSMTPGSQAMAPTAVGSADITKAMAEAGEANAGAGEKSAMAKRALAGIGADKAANYIPETDANGNMIMVDRLNPSNTQPITMGGKPVAKSAAGGGSQDMNATDYQSIGATDPATGKVNPLKVQAFAAWQSQQAAADPRFANKAYAMQQFQQKQLEASQNQPQRTNIMLPSLDAQGNPSHAPFPIIGTAGSTGPSNPAASAMNGAPAPANAPPPGMPGAMAAMGMGGGAPGAPPADAAPTAALPAVAGPPSKVPGVPRAPNGAYLPKNAADYKALPAGSTYIRPGETVPRTKAN